MTTELWRKTYGMDDAFRVHVVATLEYEEAPAATKPRRSRPMLAKTFDGCDDFPVYVQPKLNGLRCLARRNGLFLRGGGRVTSMPHIERALEIFFTRRPQLVLDGELYCHGMSLGRIAGAARSATASDDATHCALHIFDYVAARPFENRVRLLSAMFEEIDSPAIQLVSTFICDTNEEIDRWYGQWLSDGYEGQMIRDPDEPYIHGRTSALLKRKPTRRLIGG